VGTPKHTLIALVEDKPGVLNRVASLFRRRGFNIESLTVGPSETPNLSRMTIVVDASNTVVEQVSRQLFKVIDVVQVMDLPEAEAIVRELALVKVSTTTPGSRSEIIELCEIYKAEIVDVAPDCLVIEITGDERRIDDMVILMRPYGIRELVRTGRAAMSRAITREDAPRVLRAV
jgi:acetolactate synthase-1/3 small subunit